MSVCASCNVGQNSESETAPRRDQLTDETRNAHARPHDLDDAGLDEGIGDDGGESKNNGRAPEAAAGQPPRRTQHPAGARDDHRDQYHPDAPRLVAHGQWRAQSANEAPERQDKDRDPRRQTDADEKTEDQPPAP